MTRADIAREVFREFGLEASAERAIEKVKMLFPGKMEAELTPDQADLARAEFTFFLLQGLAMGPEQCRREVEEISARIGREN